MAPASSVGAVTVAIFSVTDSDQYEVGMSASMAAFTRVVPSLLCSVFYTPDSLSASVGFGSSQAP